MKPTEHNPVHSPYVVVLGGNSVRKKSTPTPDVDSHERKSEKPEQHVYGVLPPIKTMSQDLREAQPAPRAPVGTKKRWWNFGGRKKSAKAVSHNSATEVQGIGMSVSPHLPSEIVHIPHVAHPPAEPKPTAPSAYRGKFMRGLAKKEYLKSKLSVQLPFHAKVGMGIALLILVVGVPVISRFIQKPAPVTAGSIVTMGTEALVAQVGKSIELPVGETPLIVIATADDIRRLNVPDSKPGNKVLLYQKTGKIVVYDAEKDKVLGVVNRTQP